LPGGLVIKRELAFTLLENICDEMYRNGITKIILLSGHGGNRYFLPLFVQTLPEKAKPYVVYYADLPGGLDVAEILDHPENGHACEAETSMILHVDEELVQMDKVPPKVFTSLNRLQQVADAGGYTQVDWYAMYPHMYVGNAHLATAEKGRKIFALNIGLLINLIRAVKADDVSPALNDEYIGRQMQPSAPAFWTEGP
jgi:creatinine amidohydrolase